MDTSLGAIRILDSTTQAAPKMVEALASYGNGRMGDGILKLVDWARQDSRAHWLTQGRFQGAAVTGIITSVSFAALTFFMHRQLKKEHEQDQNVISDLIDEIAVIKAEPKLPQETDKKNEGEHPIANDAQREGPEC